MNLSQKINNKIIKKMKKIVQLTENDLKSIVKKIIKEQRFSILSKLLRNGGDDLVKRYGDDVANSIDDTLASALSKSINVGVNQNGKQFLKSKYGNPVTMEQIKYMLDQVSLGKRLDDIDANCQCALITLLPRELADGTPFRTIIQNELSKKITQKPTNVSGQGIIGSQRPPYTK
jgi:hypothetical protein